MCVYVCMGLTIVQITAVWGFLRFEIERRKHVAKDRNKENVDGHCCARASVLYTHTRVWCMRVVGGVSLLSIVQITGIGFSSV